jgi:hypothetical protein
MIGVVGSGVCTQAEYMRALEGLALSRAGKIALPGLTLPTCRRSTLAAAPVLFAHAIVTVAQNCCRFLADLAAAAVPLQYGLQVSYTDGDVRWYAVEEMRMRKYFLLNVDVPRIPAADFDDAIGDGLLSGKWFVTSVSQGC